MGTVHQLPTLQSLQDQVTGLTTLVTGLLAVLSAYDKLEDDWIFEAITAGRDAVSRGPRLGQKEVETHEDAIYAYACNYIDRYMKTVRAECDRVEAALPPDGGQRWFEEQNRLLGEPNRP